MKVQLFSIDHVPATLPVWHLILGDLGDPPAHRVARVLGVGKRTVYRWNRAGHAPKSATLALYWLTRWGRSAVHAQAVNDALMAVALAGSLERERDQLQARLAHVLALADTGAANRPLLGD
jgi:predicted DNA-binding transcriptional regulator AlpA